MYQIDNGQIRLLYVSEGPTNENLKSFLLELGKVQTEQLEFAYTGISPAYLDVIARYPKAVNILDRFHILKKFKEAIDQIRRAEV